jgi:hypothetical protein
VSDLDKLAHDLTLEAEITPREVRGTVSKGAVNIKKDWRQRAQGIEHAPRYPLSIGYDDLNRTSTGYEVAIGPEDSAENQGFLGDVLEFGGAHNAPRNDGGQALDAEVPKLTQAIQGIAGKRLT